MILIDYSQLIIANLMAYIGSQPSTKEEPISEDLIRHMVLNNIRSLRNKFYTKYGEIVICCDDRLTWRKKFFPEYKSHRKKDREDSPHNWDEIFSILHKIKQELIDNMPYKVLSINEAEADDIIAVLCMKYGVFKNGKTTEKILIISSDKDFLQLQKYINVYQYSPLSKKFISTDNPEKTLREHVILGDKGDGIPNCFSENDTFVAGKRQQPISRKKLNEWNIADNFDYNMRKLTQYFDRNDILINFANIPLQIQHDIDLKFEYYKTVPRSNLLKYFTDHKLRAITMNIGDF